MPERSWFTFANKDAEVKLLEIAADKIDPAALEEANAKKQQAEAFNVAIDMAIKGLEAQREILGDDGTDNAIAAFEKRKKKIPEPKVTKDKVLLWIIQLAAKSEKALAPVVKSLKATA